MLYTEFSKISMVNLKAAHADALLSGHGFAIITIEQTERRLHHAHH